MKTLKEFGDLVFTNKDMPTKLADVLVQMNKDYGELCDDLLPIERAKINFFLEHKDAYADKPLSDKTVEAMWLQKGNGVLERRMEMYKKALEKMMSNVKAILREKENQSRNLH